MQNYKKDIKIKKYGFRCLITIKQKTRHKSRVLCFWWTIRVSPIPQRGPLGERRLTARANPCRVLVPNHDKVKHIPKGYVPYFLVDDQGAFATLKENQRFSDPFQGSRPCRLKRKKHAHKRVFLVLVDDQGLEPWAH